MSMEVLRVVAAAIRDVDGKVFSVEPPGRHHDVVNLMVSKGRPCPPLDCYGFILSDGRFCRRKSARLIAERAGQLLARAMKLSELYSEDVW